LFGGRREGLTFLVFLPFLVLKIFLVELVYVFEEVFDQLFDAVFFIVGVDLGLLC
jgi:hypothetical protein